MELGWWGTRKGVKAGEGREEGREGGGEGGREGGREENVPNGLFTEVLDLGAGEPDLVQLLAGEDDASPKGRE